MTGNLNPRIVGAFLVGFALIAGTYLLTNFGASYRTFPSDTENQQATAFTVREPIATTDTDGNGVEDWKDALINNKPRVFIPEAARGEYEIPDTLTANMGIDLLQDMVLAKGYGPIGAEPEEVIERVVARTTNKVDYDLYGFSDLVIIDDSPAAIKRYANEAADIITRNSLQNQEGELSIFKRAIDAESAEILDELDPIVGAYQGMRDDYLNTPVPKSLVGQHLDIINMFNALSNNIDGFKTIFDDPVYALISMRNYESDVNTFIYAMRNMAVALAEHSSYFNQSDPAILFVVFHPQFTQ